MKEKSELFVCNHDYEVLPACVGDCPGVKGQGRGGEGPYLSDEVRILLSVTISPHLNIYLSK